MSALANNPADQDFQFSVRYRLLARGKGKVAGKATGKIAADQEPPWLDYSHHPASKLGLHNALLAVHDRKEILQARGEAFECSVFLVRHGQFEPLTQDGAERLFASLPSGDVKWLDLCQCLLPPIAELAASAAGATTASNAAARQLPLFPHVHTPYDDLDEAPAQHALDTAA